MKGILVDDNNELQVSVKRDSRGMIMQGLVIDHRKMQDVFLILSLNQGDVKEDPLIGANLLKMIRGGKNIEKIRKTIEIALERGGIKFDDVKDQVQVLINKENI